MVRELARKIAGRAVVVQLNTDESPATSQRFNIRGVPAIRILRGGKAIDSIDGALDMASLLARIQRYLA